jgi:hypothetical protein
MRKNWLTTIGGIMAGFGVIPIALGAAKVAMPPWLYILCICFAAIGPVIVGVAAKGQDEHSTATQVAVSTVENPAVEQKAVIEAKVAAIKDAPPAPPVPPKAVG